MILEFRKFAYIQYTVSGEMFLFFFFFVNFFLLFDSPITHDLYNLGANAERETGT